MDVVSYLLGKNSSSGGGGGGSTPKSFTEFDNSIIKNVDGLLEYWNNTPKLRNAIESGNTTLYTPSSQCSIYYIFEYQNKYYIWWLPNYCYFKSGDFLYETLIQNNQSTAFDYNDGWSAQTYQSYVFNDKEEITTYYYCKTAFNTLDDLINGMKNNTIQYVSSSGRRWSYYAPTLTNAIMGSKDLNPLGDIFNDTQIISHNETIIQA